MKTRPSTSHPTLVGLDIGFGQVKVTSGPPDSRGVIPIKRFSSHALPATRALSGEQHLGPGRDTVVIPLGGKLYEVGPGTDDLTLEDTRKLDDTYVFSDEYKALFIGTLALLGHSRIDVLVLGLPVSATQRSIRQVRDHALAVHDLGPFGSCEVKDVMVVTQGLAAYRAHIFDLSFSAPESVNGFTAGSCMIVDVGFLTLDWVALRNNRTLRDRCGSCRQGVSAVMQRIAESISRQLDCQPPPAHEVDRALRERRGTLKIRGEEIDVTEHLNSAHDVMQSALTQMMRSVGDASLFETILICGGGADLYQPVLQDYLGGRTIERIRDPQTANARGYHVMAYAKHMSEARA